MFGGSGKQGRGVGGGGRGRWMNSSFPPPSANNRQPSHMGRTSFGGGTASGNRLSISGTSSNTPIKTTSTEETFSLVSRSALFFASIIRLAPDLVEEIKRVEAHGEISRIKFDSSGSNPSGNIIEVGEKVYRFTWSADGGDLCNIYEEHQGGGDGDGLLVECGSAWRKLNVQRVLDESTKNHVKMMSEEAERKLKSRKAIVLEQGNPSLKSQAKAMAAVEANPWRMAFKQKDFKKRKLEVQKSGACFSTKPKNTAASPVHGGAVDAAVSPFPAVKNPTLIDSEITRQSPPGCAGAVAVKESGEPVAEPDAFWHSANGEVHREEEECGESSDTAVSSSESDSKQVSDEDVDIMTSDDDAVGAAAPPLLLPPDGDADIITAGPPHHHHRAQSTGDTCPGHASSPADVRPASPEGVGLPGIAAGDAPDVSGRMMLADVSHSHGTTPPARDDAQYRDHVREYQEKYGRYVSLSETLEGYRDEFGKMGMDLESARDRDDTARYYHVLSQLTDSYRHCGPRHKRLKRIFILLHEELKQLKRRIKDYADGSYLNKS